MDYGKVLDYDEVSSALAECGVGDELEVTTLGQKPRRVVVNARDDSGKYGVVQSCFVTSGKVRPRNFSGGRVYDRGLHEGVFYQPTLQQQTRRVTALRVIRHAGQRN